MNFTHGACWNEYWNTERNSLSLLETNSVGSVTNSRIHEAGREGREGGGKGREGGRGGRGEGEGGGKGWEGGRGGRGEGEGGREKKEEMQREESCHLVPCMNTSSITRIVLLGQDDLRWLLGVSHYRLSLGTQ